MAKFDKRLKSRLLRRKGESIILISNKLKVSKSSVSMWCRDIILTQKQSEKLNKNKGISYVTGQRMGAEINRNKKIIAIDEANSFGLKSVGKISRRDLLLICTALYWCEGSKTDTTSSFVFVNSDPEMILLTKNFLTNVMRVNHKEIFCRIQINRIHKPRIKKVLIFWKKLLKLSNSQIRKPYFVNTKVGKIYDNHESYYGVCRLIVSKSKYLKYRLLGLIKAIKLNTLSA